MARLEAMLVKSKFRGSMLGSLLGDCLGSPFEGDMYSPGMKSVVNKYFDKLDSPPGTGNKEPIKGYTDDTAMTKSVAQTLIDKPAVDYTHMARLFTEEYFREPRRGYGGNVVDTFHALRNEKYSDVFAPAKQQFNGRGSYGNGGAMRVSPIALFFHNNYNTMVNEAKKVTEITHTHPEGVNGAVLQAIAIQQSLLMRPGNDLDVSQFANDLINKMQAIEGTPPAGVNDEDPTPYQTQLNYMVELLNIKNPDDPVQPEEVIGLLGTSISALHSVPTAIYCFLKAFQGFPEVQTDNIFQRAVEYACILGGDTDTIASMAGAIAGAYFGDSTISPHLLRHCEGYKDIITLADKLYESAESCN